MVSFFQQAKALDRDDVLAGFRNDFYHADDHLIYLDGNSLGRLPAATASWMEDVIKNQWGRDLIQSWNNHWFHLPQRLAAKLAALIGAQADEVFIGDSTSINFYKLAFAALKHQAGKKNILTDNLNFPSDYYLLQGLISESFPQHRLMLVQSADGIVMDNESLAKSLDAQTALLTLSHVTFKSSFMYDMAKVNALAQTYDVPVLWDLSHAAGAVPLHLNRDQAQLAVGCTYKYLNGGPGSPAFLYVSKAMQQKMVNPNWGWMGHSQPFEFDFNYQKAANTAGFAVGTPHILSLAAIEPGLLLMEKAGMERLFAKSRALSVFFQEMIQQKLEPIGFKFASPNHPDQRGSHISLRHPEGFRISKALIQPEKGVKPIIPDFRPPDNIRFGIAPLYNSFTDLCACVERLESIVLNKEYEAFNTIKEAVT